MAASFLFKWQELVANDSVVTGQLFGKYKQIKFLYVSVNKLNLKNLTNWTYVRKIKLTDTY